MKYLQRCLTDKLASTGLSWQCCVSRPLDAEPIFLPYWSGSAGSVTGIRVPNCSRAPFCTVSFILFCSEQTRGRKQCPADVLPALHGLLRTGYLLKALTLVLLPLASLFSSLHRKPWRVTTVIFMFNRGMFCVRYFIFP